MEEREKHWEAVILDAWNPKVLTYIVHVVNMEHLDYVLYYCGIHTSVRCMNARWKKQA